MAIGPLELNGMMSRTQDISIIQQNEDNKAVLNQALFQNRMEKEEEKRASVVEHAQDSDTRQRKQDASEKGNHEYTGDGGLKRPGQKKRQADGIVVKKTGPHFDCQI